MKRIYSAQDLPGPLVASTISSAIIAPALLLLANTHNIGPQDDVASLAGFALGTGAVALILGAMASIFIGLPASLIVIRFGKFGPRAYVAIAGTAGVIVGGCLMFVGGWQFFFVALLSAIASGLIGSRGLATNNAMQLTACGGS